MAASLPFLLLKAIAHATGFSLQLLLIDLAGTFMDRVPGVCFDHFSKFQISGNGAQFDVCKPLPDVRAPFQIVEKSLRACNQGPVLAVGTQAQIHAIQISLSSHARKR